MVIKSVTHRVYEQFTGYKVQDLLYMNNDIYAVVLDNGKLAYIPTSQILLEEDPVIIKSEAAIQSTADKIRNLIK